MIFGTKEDNNNSTSQEESQEVMNSFNAEDGSALTDLTQTPEDIKALMEAEEQVIGSQTVKGKTSEESYTGGGTIVAYDGSWSHKRNAVHCVTDFLDVKSYI